MSDRSKAVNPNVDKTRRLIYILLGVVVFGLLSARVIWPKVIAPLVDLSDKIAKKSKESEDLEQKLSQTDALRVRFHEYVRRNSGTSVNQVRDELSRRLERLLTETHLREKRVAGQEPKRDRKTSIATLTYSIQAQGSLQQVVDFLRQFYELPFVARLNDLHLYPLATAGKNKGADQVAMSATVEALVLPDNSTAGKHKEGATPPETLVRHRGADYSRIAMRTPFNEYVPPPPEPPKPQTPQGACCVATPDEHFACSVITLAECQALGGTYKGDYSRCETNPCEPAPSPGPGEQPKRIEDPQRPFKSVLAALSYGVDEVRINNTQTQQHEYVAVGRAMDGGELVLVHPLGAVVHKEDGDYVYPLGKTFVESVRLNEAREYPEIIVAMRRQKAALAAAKEHESHSAAIDESHEPGDTSEEAAGNMGASAEDEDQDWEPPRVYVGPWALPPEPGKDFVGPPYVPTEVVPAEESGPSDEP